MKGQWFQILEIARGLCSDRKTFTAADLAEKAGFQNTVNPKTDRTISTKEKIAYGWISKFLRWGYVRRVASSDGTSGRRVTTYAMTTSGESCKPIEGWRTKLSRLVMAVRAYQQVRGGKQDARIFAELIRICDEIERSRKVGREDTWP